MDWAQSLCEQMKRKPAFAFVSTNIGRWTLGSCRNCTIDDNKRWDSCRLIQHDYVLSTYLPSSTTIWSVIVASSRFKCASLRSSSYRYQQLALVKFCGEYFSSAFFRLTRTWRHRSDVMNFLEVSDSRHISFYTSGCSLNSQQLSL